MGYVEPVVVVHRAYGFRFVIYTSDHDPAHVHITGAGQAKISLLGADNAPEVVYSIGMKRSDMRRLIAEVVEHRATLLREWDSAAGR